MAHFLRNEYGEGRAVCDVLVEDGFIDDEQRYVECGDEPAHRCWGCDGWMCEEHTHFVGAESPRAKFCAPCLEKYGDEYQSREKRMSVA